MGRPLAEEELVERARRGDERAYEELVRMYQGIAFRTAYLLTVKIVTNEARNGRRSARGREQVALRAAAGAARGKRPRPPRRRSSRPSGATSSSRR